MKMLNNRVLKSDLCGTPNNIWPLETIRAIHFYCLYNNLHNQNRHNFHNQRLQGSKTCHIYESFQQYISSGKKSDPGHFLKFQGNFFCHFYVPFFTYF